MKRVLSLTLTLILLLPSFLFTSCVDRTQKYTKPTVGLFDTVTTIVAEADSQEEFDTLFDEIVAMLGYYHRLFDIYHTYDGMNNLKNVNDAAGSPVTVDTPLLALLSFGIEAYEKTDGSVNIAIGGLTSVWHRYRAAATENPTAAALPSEAELSDAAAHTDIASIVIDRENSAVCLTDEKVRIDVGAIAKGYAVERVAEALIARGITGVILNVGGNIRVIGTRRNGDCFTVGVENPNGGYTAVLAVRDVSVVTSGSYLRYYTVNGKRYHHLIDTKTHYPADFHTAVTVVTPDAGLADMLSTALFCMPYSDGIALLSQFENAEAIWVNKDGETKTSDGFSRYLYQK